MRSRADSAQEWTVGKSRVLREGADATLFTSSLRFAQEHVVSVRDKDGVTDDKDRCPDTAAGIQVDEIGCFREFVLRGVQFETESSALSASARSELDKVVAAFKRLPSDVATSVRVSVEQASGKRIARGAGSLNTFSPVLFPCDDTAHTLSVGVLADPAGVPFKHGLAIFTSTAAAGAG